MNKCLTNITIICKTIFIQNFMKFQAWTEISYRVELPLSQATKFALYSCCCKLGLVIAFIHIPNTEKVSIHLSAIAPNNSTIS